MDNFQLMQIAPSGGQIGTNALHYMLAKFETNSGGITWWSNFQLIQVTWGTTYVQWAKFGTNASGILFSWRDNSIPWVRCASANVLMMPPLSICGCALLYECACGNINIHFGLFICQVSITFFQNTGKHMPQFLFVCHNFIYMPQFGFVQGDFFKKFQVQKT